MNISQFIRLINGKRTVILTDDDYGVITLICHCIKDEEILRRPIYNVIFTDNMHRRFILIANSIIKEKPDLEEILRSIRIIKIGKSKGEFFTEPVGFIDITRGLNYIFNSLKDYLNSIEEESIVLFWGFQNLAYIFSKKGIWKNFMNMSAEIKPLTEIYIGYMRDIEDYKRFFDIVVTIRRIEEFLLKPERIYDVYVEYSILRELPPMPLFRIVEDQLQEI